MADVIPLLRNYGTTSYDTAATAVAMRPLTTEHSCHLVSGYERLFGSPIQLTLPSPVADDRSRDIIQRNYSSNLCYLELFTFTKVSFYCPSNGTISAFVLFAIACVLFRCTWVECMYRAYSLWSIIFAVLPTLGYSLTKDMRWQLFGGLFSSLIFGIMSAKIGRMDEELL
jgi:hypothetical protein